MPHTLNHMSNITLLTFNFAFHSHVFRSNDIFLLLSKQLIDHNPDIVCLQEIVFSSQVQTLNQSLANQGYKCTTSSKIINKTGLFIASKHPISNTSLYTFNHQKSQALFKNPYVIGNHIISMGYIIATLKLPHTKINLINTQLQYSYPEDSIKSVHASQIHQILKHISPDQPTILTGDLNITPFSKSCSQLLASRLQDASSEITHTYFPNRYPKLMQKLSLVYPQPAKFDYIFHTHHFKSLKTTSPNLVNANGKPLSDHNPLLANFTMEIL